MIEFHEAVMNYILGVINGLKVFLFISVTQKDCIHMLLFSESASPVKSITCHGQLLDECGYMPMKFKCCMQ